MPDYKDWLPHLKFPEDTCYCRCGHVFRSHARIDMERRRSISRKPCPGCEKHDELRRVTSDQEVWTVSSKDVGTLN